MNLATPIVHREQPPPPIRRVCVRVRGSVQGVGFRPFVYGLAQRFALGGSVMNDAEGVRIEVEGEAAPIAVFLRALEAETPPLAHIDAIETTVMPSRGEREFVILESCAGRVTTRIATDAATCEACLDELFDPASRFHLYPFVNCTHCGPRYSITARLPYDRANTTMAGFTLCPACARDYRDPANRRFHAEPVACAVCGPRLSHPVAAIVTALRQGRIVAIKSLGGFHLICDALNEETVARLRQRKDRDAKPFAVMVASAASLDAIVAATEAERALIQSVERPIVLMQSRSVVASSVAPKLTELGVMLPYTPLHHLIFHAAAGGGVGREWQQHPVDLVLVATSANPGGEPLVIDDDDALRRLGGIADLIVTHDRPIVIRSDDSVMRVVDGAPAFIRRARGFVPRPIRLAQDVPPLLAVGGYLKNTVTVTRGREAFVSQHIGDLDNAESIRFFEETVSHLLAITDVTPVAVAHDLHHDFFTTQFAQGLGIPTLAVQHHHAHVAAVAAEHGVDGPVLGLVLDGFGLGLDNENWGGELLRCDGARFTRLGSLQSLMLPGGDAAAREPWRMAAAALAALGRGGEIASRFADRAQASALAALMARGAVPVTTSAGRLFDAAAGLLGTSQAQAYEGQAAMELEARVVIPRVDDAGWYIDDHDNRLSLLPLLARFAVEKTDSQSGAELFHGTLAAALVDWVSRAARAHGLVTVALGGGCFLNRVLSEAVVRGLRAAGLVPLLPRALPPNDGGLSFGQAMIAAAHLIQETIAGE